jgi:hypothetical protein
MQKTLSLFSICLLLLTTGCSRKHLINNKEYLLKVEKAFSERQKTGEKRKAELFSVFNRNLSIEQVEALKFLFAFCPLSDLADYDGDFFLSNADLALKSKAGTPWGKSIPEDIFIHYVLPFRVNNENLDSFRIHFYDELERRINGLDETSAALEINHWCHEKVSYQPSDSRTSSPMSTVLSARGRCGEESTFTVAALRTAGIPARQVYTPRWAHSDDNHAWVEVWIDGNWYYMGACEPEPVLDRGWFTEPARRAMLIHTKSFGASTGNENAVKSLRNYTEVNCLSKYAVTKKISVKVTDKQNNPVDDAAVEYQLYNYAEFYPLAVVPSDNNGISTFETGLGDLLIWARKGDAFNFRKISVNETDTLTIQLDCNTDSIKYLELDLGVPVVRTPFKGPDQALVAENNRRVTEENNIRQEYINSWIKEEDAARFADNIGADQKVIKDIISRSMGNYGQIILFLNGAKENNRQQAIRLLLALADKDLRDIKADILNDHLNRSVRFDSKLKYPEKFYYDYVLNPRIANEMIAAWRGYLAENTDPDITKSAISDPSLLAGYASEKVQLNNDDNYYKTPLTPIGADRLGFADSFSRDIYFVALCRTIGIPSRLEPGSNIPQYYSEDKWNDAKFPESVKPVSGKGYIKLVSAEKNPVPEYYTHFTLAKFDNGRYNTLEFDNNRRVNDFKEELSLTPGNYFLVTGNRLNDSRILSTITFFTLKENEHKVIDIKLKRDISPPEVLGQIDLKLKFPLAGGRSVCLDTLAGKGVVLLWVEPDREPTKHIFNDLPLLKSELQSWGGYFIFLTRQQEKEKYFNYSALNGLPEKSLFGSDNDGSILKSVSANLQPSEIRLPYIIVADKSGNIIFRSEGYRIGIGEQIIRKVR